MEASPTLETVAAKVIKRWAKTGAIILPARAAELMSHVEVTTRAQKSFTLCQIRSTALSGHDAVGVAKLSPDDDYNEDIGAGIAMFRAVEDLFLEGGAIKLGGSEPEGVPEGVVLQ